jgi:hypothetical protein
MLVQDLIWVAGSGSEDPGSVPVHFKRNLIRPVGVSSNGQDHPYPFDRLILLMSPWGF